MPMFAQPEAGEIVPISPRAQIEQGAYRTPTFLVHGTGDDLIPWRQTQGTYEALVERGVPAGVRIVEGAEHLFDLRERGNKNWSVVREAYGWLVERLGDA
ncbi:uncharacterized protein BDZ99DRAFT_526890 [Mytilinidion resinicola]|uniref:Peptidase S9 prolyl oligopeptidase catalytic domain-containing protein n=1 Tax=Mytilinidion resinicola TaxID=574789 RepID=A0A6A6Y2T8_9PEZI|nr:uncharacterized protein BDZ99DRAFT_526890 [Mytilinidion resinicola]KAF2803146.1 hypothetical protein BDZ99DRAFT_526890 [Mytilinidion resinicola]